MGHGGQRHQTSRAAQVRREVRGTRDRGVGIDYRHFGNSEGRPRQVIDVTEQQDDYRAAVRFARDYDGIDSNRIAFWGTSLSGGHVLAVAAADPTIAAVVSQVPLNGRKMFAPTGSRPRANGHAWTKIARALGTNPDEARLRFDPNPQSPTADGPQPLI